MSDAHDHGASHDGAEAADAHGHDEFDPEPAETLSEGEPRTPSWMPLLGVGVFLCGAVWFLASDGPAATAAMPVASAVQSAAPVAATPPPPSSARPPQNPVDRQKLLDAMKKRKEQLDAAKAAGSGAPAPLPTVQRPAVPPRKAP